MLLLLFVVPRNERSRILEQIQDAGPVREKTWVCVIDTGDDLFGRFGLQAGLNYEMLRRFAEAEDLQMEIRAARSGENYADSLSEDRVDIVALALADSIPPEEFRKSVDIDRYCAWFTRDDELTEMKLVNSWLTQFRNKKEYNDLVRRFYRTYDPFKRLEHGLHSPVLSPYDELIKKYAAPLGWDWRLLAAIIYQESKFSINSFSSRGACGLMQVLPGTAAYYGIEDLLDPEENIKAGSRHLARLQKVFEGEEFGDTERLNFTIAAYNAGEGRIADCRWFAQERGPNSAVWADVVTLIPEMRKYTMTREDGTERTSYFRGTETINYVERVWEIYDAFCELHSDPAKD